RKEVPVDWCPKDNTTLAREQVIGPDRRCERCGTPVIRKNLVQWLFKITDYAEELLDFSKIEWPERVRTLQTNWIGRSEGTEIVFEVEGYGPVEVFTTRPDTLFGATFFVMSPEHPAVEKITTPERSDEVRAYVEKASRMSEIDRTDVTREKTGVFTGAYAVNPANDERIPVFIADYVLMAYGTGAIMAVPAHDERDGEFARKYGVLEWGRAGRGVRRRGHDGQLRPLRRHAERRRQGEGNGLARGAGSGKGNGDVPAARLAHLASEVLGHTHTHHLLRLLRNGPRPRGGPARPAPRGRRVHADGRVAPEARL
ncbi:MAG: class I tRNA ligase family protein, partial [Actinobacteria bacterium]|nr:class I tRNA ligase family protein [Actinomycetota bacterium]